MHEAKKARLRQIEEDVEIDRIRSQRHDLRRHKHGTEKAGLDIAEVRRMKRKLDMKNEVRNGVDVIRAQNAKTEAS